MSACNARPPEGHPFHGTLVACHLAADHLKFDEPHSWDIDAIAARNEIIAGAVQRIRERFPERSFERVDSQLPHPLVAYEVDEHGKRASEPYRQWDLPAGPWVLITFVDGGQFAIWKTTGDVYRVGPRGAVDEDPIIPGDR